MVERGCVAVVVVVVVRLLSVLLRFNVGVFSLELALLLLVMLDFAGLCEFVVVLLPTGLVVVVVVVVGVVA